MGTPMILNGRTLVPLRHVGYLLGAEIDWNPHTSTAYVIANNQLPRKRASPHGPAFLVGKSAYVTASEAVTNSLDFVLMASKSYKKSFA